MPENMPRQCMLRVPKLLNAVKKVTLQVGRLKSECAQSKFVIATMIKVYMCEMISKPNIFIRVGLQTLKQSGIEYV